VTAVRSPGAACPVGDAELAAGASVCVAVFVAAVRTLVTGARLWVTVGVTEVVAGVVGVVVVEVCGGVCVVVLVAGVAAFGTGVSGEVPGADAAGAADFAAEDAAVATAPVIWVTGSAAGAGDAVAALAWGEACASGCAVVPAEGV
jgi:hypothetical protein